MKKLIFLFILIFFLTPAGCFQRADVIKDLRDLRQEHSYYQPGAAETAEVLTPQMQARMDEDYNIIYFSVWYQPEPFHALTDRVRYDFERLKRRPGYGENKRRHSSDWLRKLEANASLNNYPNALYPAITTRNTNLRILPTQGAHFNSPDGEGSGWPFDNLQRSSVAANTPIFVCHISADKSWALIETNFTFGWIPIEDSARVDVDFIKKWETGSYAAITVNQTSVYDEHGNFILRASIGHIFPLAGKTPGYLEILVAVADANSNAVIKKGFVAQEHAVPKPLSFTPANAAKIADELIGEPYGWGGLYGNRDCSAMTRDFFAPFGIWLPRHSADQVTEVGNYIDLQGLTPEEKEQVILAKGIPYLTLLWHRGHVMLYIGNESGRALIFHNVWGIRTKDENGNTGRRIIGQAVITTLRPGYELNNIDEQGGYMLDRMAAMNVLVPYQAQPQ